MRNALPILLLLAACGPDPRTKHSGTAVAPSDSSLIHLARMAERLTGAWVDTSADGHTLFHEHWEHSAGSDRTGLGFVMSGPDTVFIEHLRISWGAEGGRYSARIPSQNNGAFVDFALRHASDDSLVFENPAHDFPQRIRYAWLPPDTWYVVVSGMVNDTLRAERFLLRAAPAPVVP